MAIFVSLVVSLTLTPMMASRFLRAHKETRHGRIYKWSERGFEAMLHAYERGLDRVLRGGWVGLRVVFALPGAGSPSGGSAGGIGRERGSHGVGGRGCPTRSKSFRQLRSLTAS